MDEFSWACSGIRLSLAWLVGLLISVVPDLSPGCSFVTDRAVHFACTGSLVCAKVWQACSSPSSDMAPILHIACIWPLLFCLCRLPHRRCGLYKFMVTMAAGQNMAHGSTMSPPRLQQVQEACQDHFETFTVHTDPLFQLWGPQIAFCMRKDSSLPGVLEEIYESMKTHELLQKKGEKVPGIWFQSAPTSHRAAWPWGMGFLCLAPGEV